MARLHKVRGQDPDLKNEADTLGHRERRWKAPTYSVDQGGSARTARASRRPPFTTSTLQQEASRKLGFRRAQRWPSRSSSTRASTSAKAARRPDHLHAHRLDQRRRGRRRTRRATSSPSAMAPTSARRSRPCTRTRAKNAQEAHEAIRPTSVVRTPGSRSSDISRPRPVSPLRPDLEALRRQPDGNAVFDATTVDIEAQPRRRRLARGIMFRGHSESKALIPGYLFRASGIDRQVRRLPDGLRRRPRRRRQGRRDEEAARPAPAGA